MNTTIESAFLAAAAALPPMDAIEHRTGVSGEDNQPENAALIVHSPECEHAVGPLWRVTVIFRLETPAFDNDREAHDARLNALREWLDDKAAVTEALEIQGMALRGYHVLKSSTSLEDNRWVAEIEIVGGTETYS